MSKIVIAVDIETSGPSVTFNDMTCFAAVAIEYPSGKELGSFLTYIKPVTGQIRYSPETLKWWQSQEAAWEKMKTGVEKKGKSANEAMGDFVDWMSEYKDNSVVVFDTASFDASFINTYLGYTSVPSIDYIHGEYKPCFDTSSFHRGVARLGWEAGPWGNDTAAGKAMGIDDVDKACPFDNSHDPLDDARRIAWTTGVISDLASRRKST